MSEKEENSNIGTITTFHTGDKQCFAIGEPQATIFAKEVVIRHAKEVVIRHTKVDVIRHDYDDDEWKIDPDEVRDALPGVFMQYPNVDTK